MPAVNVTSSSAVAFVVPQDTWGYRLRNISDTTIYERVGKTVATSGDDMGLPIDPGCEKVVCFASKLVSAQSIFAIHGGSGNKALVYDILRWPAQTVSHMESQMGGFTANPSATFNRPANITAYASGDLVANDTTAGSVTPLSFAIGRVAGGSFVVRKARLKKSNTSTTNASFRLHLYTSSPATITNGDNGAWSTSHSGYVGSFDFSSSNALPFTDAVAINGTPVVGSEVSVKLASGQTLYGLLEARAAYTPASGETFTVELEAFQD